MNTSVQVHRSANKEEEANTKGVARPIRNSNMVGIQNSAKVVMNNDTQDINMLFYKNQDWYGSAITPYPYGISPNSTADFVNLADLANGSMGAVVYNGKINQITECAWLLAWSAPVGSESDPPKNQVYVETGKQENYDQIDWALIKGKLDISTSQSSAQDQVTGCNASAEIFTGTNNTAVITAHFNIVGH